MVPACTIIMGERFWSPRPAISPASWPLRYRTDATFARRTISRPQFPRPGPRCFECVGSDGLACDLIATMCSFAVFCAEWSDHGFARLHPADVRPWSAAAQFGE